MLRKKLAASFRILHTRPEQDHRPGCKSLTYELYCKHEASSNQQRDLHSRIYRSKSIKVITAHPGCAGYRKPPVCAESLPRAVAPLAWYANG